MVHSERDFAEEDDVGTQPGSTGAERHLIESAVDGVVFYRGAAAIVGAAGLGEFAVHVEEANGAGALVKVVDVLAAEEEAVAELGREFGEGGMGGLGLSRLGRRAACGVELPDQCGIAVESFGGADVLDAMAGPKTVGGTEGREAAFGADAGAGEDEDTISGGDGNWRHEFNFSWG